jgi:hypothetical protein
MPPLLRTTFSPSSTRSTSKTSIYAIRGKGDAEGNDAQHSTAVFRGMVNKVQKSVDAKRLMHDKLRYELQQKEKTLAALQDQIADLDKDAEALGLDNGQVPSFPPPPSLPSSLFPSPHLPSCLPLLLFSFLFCLLPSIYMVVFLSATFVPSFRHFASFNILPFRTRKN